MASVYPWPEKDPSDSDWRHAVWCDEDGTNSGAAADDGELQGATISSYVITTPAGITLTSDNKSAVAVRGVSYGANTVINLFITGGTEGATYDFIITVTLSDGRVLSRTFRLPVRGL